MKGSTKCTQTEQAKKGGTKVQKSQLITERTKFKSRITTERKQINKNKKKNIKHVLRSDYSAVPLNTRHGLKNALVTVALSR